MLSASELRAKAKASQNEKEEVSSSFFENLFRDLSGRIMGAAEEGAMGLDIEVETLLIAGLSDRQIGEICRRLESKSFLVSLVPQEGTSHGVLSISWAEEGDDYDDDYDYDDDDFEDDDSSGSEEFELLYIKTKDLIEEGIEIEEILEMIEKGELTGEQLYEVARKVIFA